jgi:hypothetical protein
MPATIAGITYNKFEKILSVMDIFAVEVIFIIISLALLVMVILHTAQKIRSRRREGLHIYPVITGCFIALLTAVAGLAAIIWYLRNNVFIGKIGG